MPGAEATDWIRSERVRQALQSLGPVLEAEVACGDPRMREVASYLVRLGGKRLRPSLLFLAQGSTDIDERSLRAAAAVEFVHLASLYHDDIIDRGERRRGAVSANKRWGNRAAMLSGAFLFARAHSLIEALGEEARRAFSAGCAALCLGQLREAENAYNFDLSIDEHLEILRLKTASLFVLAVRIGASVGAVPEGSAQGLANFAGHLGLAFQLCDDMLDIAGDPAATGKDIGADVRGGIYSLPILMILRQGGETSRALRRLIELKRIDDRDLRALIHIVRASTAAASSLALARTESLRAIEALAPLPHGPERASLEALARFAVERHN